MSDSKTRVREIAQELGLTIADERLDALAAAWEQAMAETEEVRGESTPWPSPSPFDVSWSEKR